MRTSKQFIHSLASLNSLGVIFVCLFLFAFLFARVDFAYAQNIQLKQGSFKICLDNLRREPEFANLHMSSWQLVQQVQPDPSVLTFLDKQPEFSMPVWDYLAVLVDAERIADGKAEFAKQRSILNEIEKRYGVAANIIVGVWGVESNFGKNLGNRPLLTSLGTLSCYGRRQGYFRGELAKSLRIIQEGHINPEKMLGSWAGAFGQTQFMPSTFLTNAVDFDNDGRRDIVDSIPDALASTANFLKKAGYQKGYPWGFEVKLPQADHENFVSNRKNKKPLSVWKSLGVRLVDGGELPTNSLPSAALLLPAGLHGPAFLVGRNFDSLYSYNASENYALAIAHLSDLINSDRTNIGFVTPWPTDDPGLSRAQNYKLQDILIKRGYQIGNADGMIGAKTREAIKAEQVRLGLKPDGRAGLKLLKALSEGNVP